MNKIAITMAMIVILRAVSTPMPAFAAVLSPVELAKVCVELVG
jgi:hypothetical protein